MKKAWRQTLKRILCYMLILSMVFDSNTASLIASAQQINTTSEEETGDTGSAEDTDTSPADGSGVVPDKTTGETTTGGETTGDTVPVDGAASAAGKEEVSASSEETSEDTSLDKSSRKTSVTSEEEEPDGAVPMLLSDDEDDEGDYVLYLGDKALNAGIENGLINFANAVTVDYGTSLHFSVKKKDVESGNLIVYYSTSISYKDNDPKGDINVNYENTITEDTVLDAGDYYLFYKSDDVFELGRAEDENHGGTVKYILRVKPVALAACTGLGWGTGENAMCAKWTAPAKDANGNALAAGAEVTYQVSLYYKDEAEPFYISDVINDTSLDLSSVITRSVSDEENPGKGYGDYSFKVTATAKTPQDKNYNKSVSAVSVNYHYSDTVKPEILSYQVIDSEDGKKLQGTATDAGTGIAAYAFAAKDTAEAEISWKAVKDSDILPGETYTASAAVSEIGAGEICFYVKDADGNISCQDVSLSEEGTPGDAIFISKVTCNDYYRSNTVAAYEKYLVNDDSLTLPVVSDTALVRTGYTFSGWYTNEQCTSEAGTSVKPGETTGFAKGAEYKLWAKWEKQTVSFSEKPEDISKVYDAADSTLTAALANSVTYDSVSWTWYYKATADAAAVEVNDASRVSGLTDRSTTCKVKNVADSGSYYAVATLTVGDEVRQPVLTDEAEVSITERPLQVKVADKEITYQDEAPSYTFAEGTNGTNEGLVGGDTIESIFGSYESGITCTYQKGDPATSDTKSYTIKYTGSVSEWNVPNYDVSLVSTGTLTVKPMDLTDSTALSADLSQEEFTYDGNAKEPEVTSLVLKQDGAEDVTLEHGEGKDYTYGYQNNTLAGQTDTAVVITFQGNYTGTYEVSFAIKKGTYTVNTTMAGWKYGETAGTPGVDTLKDSGKATYYYLPVEKDAEGNYLSDEDALAVFSADGFNTSGKTTTKPVNAGKYYVWAVISATSNYEEIQAAPAVFTIAKRQIIITPESKTWPYDGNVHTAGSITAENITGDGFVGEDDFLSIAVSGSIKDIGTVNVTVVPKLNTATNPDNYDIIVNEAALTITETKLATPSTFKWSTTPGTLSWIAITKDNLEVSYEVSLYRAQENPDGSIKKDTYGEVMFDETPVATDITSNTSYSFLDKIIEDSAADQHAYAATIRVLPVYEEDEVHNYVQSDASAKTDLKYTAKVTLNVPGEGVKRAYIGEELAEDSTESLTTSYVLLQGQSIALHMETENGYTYNASTWSVNDTQKDYVSFSSRYVRNPLLTLVDNSDMSWPQEISVTVKAVDDYPDIVSVTPSMAADYSKVNVALAFSDVLGLDSYALVKGSKEDEAPGPWTAIWKTIPREEDSKAKTSYIVTEPLTEAGIYYVYVKDISGNITYRTTPVVVYQITFDTGVEDDTVTGEMPSIVKLKDQPVVLPEIQYSKAGYGFTNWTGATGIYANKGNYVANQSDTLKAGWTDEKVNYTVRYFYQKLTETTNAEGAVETALSYEEADSVSFDSAYGVEIAYDKPEIQAAKTGYKLTNMPVGIENYQSAITATENGQELCLYYNLEQYQVTYKYTDEDDQVQTVSDSYYYGQTVRERAKPSTIGYTFVGWDWGEAGQAPSTMPNKNLTVTGSFQAEQTKYYIVYYKQNLDQNNSSNQYLAKSFEKDDTLTEEITAHYGDTLAAYLAEPASPEDGKETVVARELTGFTPAAVQVSNGSPVTIGESEYDTWINGSKTSAEGTVQKQLTEEEISAAPGYQNGPTYICFYYTRNLYDITLDVYKDARENGVHLFGSYYDGNKKVNCNGETVTDNDGARWTLPYGYIFADENSEGNEDGIGSDGSYKASYFENFGYLPLDEANTHSQAWTKRWPTEGTSKDKYYLATFVDWSTGERPATMPAGDASVTREYASKELSRYVIEVYTEDLEGVSHTVTLDDNSTTSVTLQEATGKYSFATSYERYGNAGDTVEIVDTMPADNAKEENHIYITVDELMKGVSNYQQYEHNPANDKSIENDDDANKEKLTAVITENTVTDSVIGNVVKLRLNLVRKEYTAVVRYRKKSSGIDEGGNSVAKDEIFATRTFKAKWGTQYLVDPLDFFDGSEQANGGNTIVDTEAARTIAATDFRNGNYIVSYSGYYWTPNSGHSPNRQYNIYENDSSPETGLVYAPALIMTVGGYSNGTDSSSGRSNMDVYYSAQEIDKHYYLKLQYEKCQADESDNTIIRETGKATDMIINSTAYPDLAPYGTNFQVCVANKCDVFQVASAPGTGSGGAESRYPGADCLAQAKDGYQYVTDAGGKEKLRDGTDGGNAFVEVTLTYSATENRDMDGSGGTLVEETGTFYIPGTQNGDSFEAYKDSNGNCLLFAVDETNQFYNGNRISYSYNSSVKAHVGRDVFMATRPTTGKVVEVANSTASLETNGKDYITTPLTNMTANSFQAYYYNVYNDYYLTFVYDGAQCSECDSHKNYSYNELVTDFNCSHFSVADGYYIAWYMDSQYTKPVEPFNIKGHTYIYGRKEKMPVENWDYAFYKLPEKTTIGSADYDWITLDNVAQISWTDKTVLKNAADPLSADNVDNDAQITGQGAETITKSVAVSYTNEYGVETTYKGLRTEWYIDGQIVMVKQPNYSMTYIEFTMDYTDYDREGFRYDETNTKNKSKAFCSTTSVNMYAYFTRESYTLTVTRNRTKNDNDEVTTRINGAKIRLEDPVKAGYTFKEWTLQKVTTDENGVNSYTDLNPSDYSCHHTDAVGSEAGYTTFIMPICNTRALAVWEPAELPDFKITHYLQDDKQTYNPELLKTVQSVSDANVSGTIKTISIKRDGSEEEKQATAYYDSAEENANLLAVSYTEGAYTYYYAGMEVPESGAIEVETANAFAVVQQVSGVKSEDKLPVKDYKLTGLGTMFDYAFTKYQQDTSQQTLTEQTTDEEGNAVDQTFTAYIDAVVEYYYQRSSSIKIRAIGLAADDSVSGLTLSGAGDHYYGEKVTLYATMQPNGYTFMGWYKASDVLKDYPEDGQLPESLESYSLKDGILDLIGTGEDKIQPITEEKTLEMTVKASGDYVAITNAGNIGTPTLTVTSKHEGDYVYNYENDTNNVLTASINWGDAGAGANIIKKYTWYYKYYDVSEMTSEQIAALDVESISLEQMTEIPNSDSGTYLFPTGQEAGYYIYRCVADIERKDNGRTGTAEGTCLVSVVQNSDYYVTYPCTYDYDGNSHTYMAGFKYNIDSKEIYYSKSEIPVDITSEELERRIALPESDDQQITTSIIRFTDVAVDEMQIDKPVIPHTVYYYIKSGDQNYATIAGSETVTINPVWLTVEAVRPFTKIYDASEKVEGSYGSKKVDGTDSDFHRLQTGSDCTDGRGYYVLHGILECDKGKTLYLNFDAAFDSMHVNHATVVTLSDMWVVQKAVNEVFNNYNYRFPNGTTLQLSGQIKPYPLEIKWIPKEDSDPEETYEESDFVYNYDGTEKHPFVKIIDSHIPDSTSNFEIQVNNAQKSVNTYDASAEVVASAGAAYEPADYTFTLGTCKYQIIPRYIKVAPRNMTKVYNGTEQTMLKTDTVNEFDFYTKETADDTWRKYESLPEGETFSVQATASGKNVGSYTIGAANLKILNESGKNISDNYVISYDEGTLTIEPCPVVVDGITADDKDYDGTTTATVNVDAAVFYPLETDANGEIKTGADGNGIRLVGLYTGDSLSLDPDKVTGEFEDAKAGIDKTVTISIDNDGAAENGSGGALLGVSKDNYKLMTDQSQKETTADIGAGTKLTVSVGDLEYVYGEQPTYNDYTLSYSGLQSGDTVENAVKAGEGYRATFEIKKQKEDGNYETVVTDGTSEAMKTLNAGTYYIFIKTTDGTDTGEAAGLAADNYTIVSSGTPGTLTIKKRPVAIAAKNGAEAITKEYDTENTVEADIVKKVDGNSTPVYYEFTKTTEAETSVEVPQSGIVNGDVLTIGSYTAQYNSADVEDATKVEVTGVTLAGEKAGNYTLKNTAFNLEGKITPKEMTITVDDQETVYGEAAPANTYTVTGAVESEEDAIEAAVAGAMTVSCDYSATSDAVANRNAGTYDIKVDSTDSYKNNNCYQNSNYDITFVDGTLTVAKRVVYYQAEDVTISYGKENPPDAYSGAFVANDAEDAHDGWCYGEGISGAKGCDEITAAITVYSDENCNTEITFSNDRNFTCYESDAKDAQPVSKTTPAGKYVINPTDVEGKIFAQNYEFKHKSGTLTIAKYYVAVENVQVLGKIYDGKTTVDSDHLLTVANDTIYNGGYPGLKFTYYEGATKIDGKTAKELASEPAYGEAYVQKLLASLKIEAEYESADVSDSSKVNISISLVEGSYLDQRYVLLTGGEGGNLQEAIDQDPEKYSATSPVTQTETTAFIVGADGEVIHKSILQRPLTLYPVDKKIKYGENISIVTSAPENGIYTLVKDQRPAESAEGDAKEIGFAEGEDFSTIGFTLDSRIYQTTLTDGRPGAYTDDATNPAYEAGSDVGSYAMDISTDAGSNCDPQKSKNYDVSYALGLLTVEQNKFPAPASVTWDETNPGTITWSEVSKIGKVEVAGYKVELYCGDTLVYSETTTDNTTRSMNLLDKMRTNGAGAYTVKVCAVASTDDNEVNSIDYANVEQYGDVGISEKKYAAKVTVKFSDDSVTNAAKTESESAKIYAEGTAEGDRDSTYIMIAGESGKNISYSWSRLGAGTGNSTVYTSGYTVDSVTVSRGESALDSSLYSLGTAAEDANGGTYQTTLSLGADLKSADDITVTLKLKAKDAAVSLTVSETHNPEMATTMYGYSGDAQPVYKAVPGVPEGSDGDTSLYDYSYEWSIDKAGTIYNKDNRPDVEGAGDIIWTNQTFSFPLGMSCLKGGYRVYCKVTATRKDNGKEKSKESFKTLTITKAKPENSVHVTVDNNGWTYGESRYKEDGVTPKVSFTQEISDLGTITLEYWDPSKAEWTTTQPTDTGSYQVRANVAGNDNYESFTTDSVEYEISQATLSAPSNITMTNSSTAPYGLVKWDAVAGPKENAGKEDDSQSCIHVKYEVTLSKTAVDATEQTEKEIIKTDTTTNTYYDFSDQIKEDGKYYVTVQAKVDPREVKEENEAPSYEKQNYDGQDANNCADSAVSTFTALITIGAEITGSGNGTTATVDGFEKVYDGTGLTLKAVYGNGTDAVLYQWMKNGQKIGEPTSDSTLSIKYVEESALYACKIYPNGMDTSAGDIIYTKNVKAEIIPREITITADSPTKQYDNTPLLTAGTDTWTISGAGLADGDTISYSSDYSSLTNVGTADNEVTAVTITRTGDASKTVYTDDTTSDLYKYNNYKVTKVDGTLMVTARPLGDGTSYTEGITVDDIGAVTYNGEEQKPDENPLGDKVIVKDVIKDENNDTLKDATLEKGIDYTVSYTNNIYAGTNTATVVIEGTGNYSGSITKTFTILPLTVEPLWGTSTFDYDGNQKEVTAAVSNKVNNDDVAFTYTENTNTATDADDYQAVISGLTGEAAGNYTIEGAENLTKDWKIKKAAGEVTITGDTSKVYDGTVIEDPSYELNGTTREVTFKYYTKGEGDTYTELDAAVNGGKPLNAGTYYAKAYAAADSNYESAESDYKEITIHKREVTITAEDKESVYSKEIKEMTYVITAAEGVLTETAPNPLVSADDLGTIRAYAKESAAPDAAEISQSTPANEYTIQISYTENNNYDVTIVTGTYTITRDEQVLAAENVTETYDGQPHEIVFNHTIGSSNHPVGDGTVTITYKKIKDEAGVAVTGEAQTSDLVDGKPVHAGTYEAVIIAGETTNYKEKSITATVSIEQRNLSIKIGSGEKTYDGTPLTEKSYTLKNETTLVASDTMTIQYPDSITDVQYDEEKNVIAVPNTAGTVVITDSESKDVTKDYDISIQEGTLKINPLSLSDITFDSDTLAYTGQPVGPDNIQVFAEVNSVSTLLTKDTDYTLTEKESEHKVTKAVRAGTYTVEAVGCGNFTGSVSKTYTISESDKPVVTGVVNDGIYCKQAAITVTDSNLDSVRITKTKADDTIEDILTADNITEAEYAYTIIGDEEDGATYTIVAKDSSGNVNETMVITVYKDHSFPTADYVTAEDGNSQTASCAHGCGAVDTRVVVQGSVHWDYAYRYDLPDGTTQSGVQGAEARATYARLTLWQDDTPIATKIVDCDDLCGSQAATPDTEGSIAYSFTSYDPDDPDKDAGDMLLPVTDETDEPYSYRVVAEPLKKQGTGYQSVNDYSVDYEEDGHIGKKALISYIPETFEVPWKVTLSNLPVVNGQVQAPDVIYVKIMFAYLENADDTETDAGYQIISQQTSILGVPCQKIEHEDGTVSYEGKYPVWKYQGGTTDSYYHRIQVTGYQYNNTYYDVADKKYKSPNGPDHTTQTICYVEPSEGQEGGASGTILYNLEGLAMPVVTFDYNEGGDNTNPVTSANPLIYSIVKDSFGARVSTEEITAVMQGVTRNHYAFEGWFDAQEGGNQITEIASLNESRTLYAHWKELVPPAGSIEVKDNVWKEFLNAITFGYFFKETQQVVIKAQDNGEINGTQTGVNNSGIRDIAYYVLKGNPDESLTPLTAAQIAALPDTSWTVPSEMSETEQGENYITFNIDPEAQYIIYARITDKAGNTTYLSSDGLLLENTPPVIEGAENDTTYCITRTVTITDDRLDSIKVTLSDGSVISEENDMTVTGREIILPGRNDGKTYTVVAVDKAGNTTTLSGVLVKEKHTWTYQVNPADILTATCEVETCDNYHEADSLTVIISGVTAPYDGKEHLAEITASDAFTDANAGTVGEITYYSVDEAGSLSGGKKLSGAPVHAGSYYAVAEVTADSGRKAEIKCSYEITPVNLGTLTLEKSQTTYNGSKQENPETVTAVVDGRTIELVKDQDYVLTSKDDTNAGQAEITVTGIGDYAGELKKTYEILPAKITLTATDKESGYGNEMAELSVEVTEGQIFDGDDLHIGAETDAEEKSPFGEYEIRPVYDDNPNYEVTAVNGVYTIKRGVLQVTTDGYEGVYDSQEHGITMYPQDEDEEYIIYYSTVPLDENNYLLEGTVQKPVFADIGEYTIYYYVVSEHYYPTAGSEEIVIRERSIGTQQPDQNCTLTINEIPDTVYDGTVKAPEVQIVAHYTVTDGSSVSQKNVILKNGIDYILTYENNRAAGTATITAKGIGNYTEVLSTTFRILPLEVELEWSEGEFEYDGTEKSVTAEIINKALPTDDVMVGTYQENKKTEEGTYEAQALTLEGADAGNYYIGDNSDAEYVWMIQKDIDSEEELEKNSLALNAKLKVSQTGKKINIFWGKVSDADGYDVYVQYCGKKFTSQSLNAVYSGKITKITVTKVNGKKLNLKKNYKIYVIAYKLVDGEKVTIGKTITAHIVGRKNTKETNVKAVKVKKSSFELKVGGTATIEGSTVLVDKNKKPLSDKHAKELRYASSDTEVATVSKTGKIKAEGKGSCTIYVYARNGYAKKVKVKVK
ncbi:MAG: InlB B-repeat-containing protein [Lachnospiraceae bacterium]